MKLTVPQQQISDDPSRYKVVSSGRRFGKSYLAINEMAKFARFPNRRVLAVAPTYKQVKNVLWDDLKAMLIERNWVKKINETELTVTLVNGSKITLRSADNFDALRGGKYDFLVMDECADINPEAFFSVLRPTLSDRKGHALFVGTPKGMGNWFFDLWNNAKTLDDWASWQFTTLDGGNVDAEEIEAARRDMDARTFEQEYLAQFVNYAGVIFYAYTEDNIEHHPGIEPYTPIYCGVDFNRSPISCAVATKTANGLHFFDEIEIYGSNTNELAEEIRNRYGFQRQIYVFPDATGKRLNTNSNGISDHIILHNAGFKVITDAANPPVADAISSVNALLCNTNGERNLLIDPKCKKIRECMIKWTYKEGTRVPDKDSGYDHMADSLRYVTHKLFPIQMNVRASTLPSVRGAGRLR